jgi:hypothetical protein
MRTQCMLGGDILSFVSNDTRPPGAQAASPRQPPLAAGHLDPHHVTYIYCGYPVLPATPNGFDIAFRGHILPLMHPRRVAEADEQTLRAEEPGDGLAPWLLFGSMDELVPFRL